MDYPWHPIADEWAAFTASEIEHMRQSLRRQGLLLPLVVWNGFKVDGRHREMLCIELGIDRRYEDISEKYPTEEKMRDHVIGLNRARRSRTEPLSNAEKRARVAAELERDPARSDVAIAEAAAVDRQVVRNVRKREVGLKPTPAAERKSRNGKVGEGQHKVRKTPEPREPKQAPSKPRAPSVQPVPPVDAAALPRTAQEKIDIAIRQEKRRLQAVFDQAVKEELKRLIDETVLPSYNQQIADAQIIIKSRKSVMPRKTYTQIRSWLHPDRITDPATKAKITEVFLIFSKYELALCGEEEMPTSAPKIPTTYEEMMKAKAEVKARRRTRRAGGGSVQAHG